MVADGAGASAGVAGALVQVPDGEPGTVWRCGCGVRWQVYAAQADDGKLSAVHRFWALASARSGGTGRPTGRRLPRPFGRPVGPGNEDR
jgi:hypothetical protein